MSTKSSKNYEYFKLLSNNRPISQSHLKNLRKQFEEYGNITEISPVTINKHGFIIDGQHRIVLCKELGLPVFYNEVDVKKEITPAMNGYQKRWGAMDYINFFAAYKPEYEMLRQFMRLNDITYPVASAVLFADYNRQFSSNRRLKDGTLVISKDLMQAQKHMDIITDIGLKMGSVMHERYVRGLVKCLYNPEFDINRFVKKLDVAMRKSPSLANPRLGAIEDVMRNIEAIYNYMNRDGSTVRVF